MPAHPAKMQPLLAGQEFLETFLVNFQTICCSFQSFESFFHSNGLGWSIFSPGPPTCKASGRFFHILCIQAHLALYVAWVFQVKIYYDFISYPWNKFCCTLFQTHYHALPLLVCQWTRTKASPFRFFLLLTLNCFVTNIASLSRGCQPRIPKKGK